MEGYVFYICILLKYLSIIHGNVCISWSLYSDQLRITCKADRIVFSVSIYNPSGIEVAHCLLPYPKPRCFSNEKFGDITQDIISGETTYVVNRHQNDTLLNGLWKCVHGSQNENASVEVVIPKTKGYKVPPKITLSGPKYVKTKQKISLLCTSNADSTDSAVIFQVYNQFYTKIFKNISGCFIGLEASICRSDVCQCFSDGRSFTLQYITELYSEVLIFRCSMNFKNYGTLSDCLFVSVVDIRGPFMVSDTEFPLSAGGVTEISCKTISKDYQIEINLNCLNTIVKTNESDNFNAYIVKLSGIVTSSDNGTICLCTSSSVVTGSSSITLNVIKAPILDTIDMVSCNNTDSVMLSCRVSGELSEFGFLPWKHRFHGTFIRSITGNVTGNISFLSIDSCNYEDNGEYICEAWNQDSKQLFHQKRYTKVNVKGPPVVIDQRILISTSVTLYAKVVSQQRLYNPKWFYKNMLLPNSTRFYQNMSEDVLVMRMYGKILTLKGYIANLTIINPDYGVFKYRLLLDNDYGTTKIKFEFNNQENGSNDFNIKLITWISLAMFLALLLVIVSAALICSKRRNSRRLAASRTIYFAAPGQINNSNIYNDTSPYEEIDDDYLVPEASESHETSVKDETEPSSEDVDHYLELE